MTVKEMSEKYTSVSTKSQIKTMSSHGV